MKESGYTCGLNRIARIMKEANIKALWKYRKHPYKSFLPYSIHPNYLNREFNITEVELI